VLDEKKKLEDIPCPVLNFAGPDGLYNIWLLRERERESERETEDVACRVAV
jgi:hypothetical protein